MSAVYRKHLCVRGGMLCGKADISWSASTVSSGSTSRAAGEEMPAFTSMGGCSEQSSAGDGMKDE